MFELFVHLRQMLSQLVSDEEGADLAEYALVLVLISIVAMVAMGILGNEISAVFCQIVGTLNGTGGC